MKTTDYDSADYLDSDEAIDAYLATVLEDGSPALIAHALGVVARARGMTDLAKKTGMTRQALYGALRAEGNPHFGTIAKVAEALGYRISLVRAGGKKAA